MLRECGRNKFRLLRNAIPSSRRNGDRMGTKSLITGPDGARNQKRLCWRGPTEVYSYAKLANRKSAVTS
jgi:hypothetical protein